MLLFNLLSVVFFRALFISACPETFVVRNVNWDNTPSDSFLLGISINEINGKSLSLKVNKHSTVVI